MQERYFIKVGNCFVEFMALWLHEMRMRSDYHKATPYLTMEEAAADAKERGVKNFKIVKKMI